MRSGNTTICGQEITVYGFTITMDIEVAWTTCPHDEPPSIEIEQIGFDEDQALSDLLHEWADCDPARRPVEMAFATASDMISAITQAVSDYVDSCQLPDDGPQHADDREEDTDGN